MDKAVTDNILDDLIKTLKDFPELDVIIRGNTGTDGHILDDEAYGNGDKALNRPTNLNGKTVPTRHLMNARAKAIMDILIDNGISPSRIKYGPGTNLDSQKGRKTTIILKNTN